MDKAQLHAFIAREQPNICQIAAYRGGITDEFNYRTVCLHILTGILYEATGMKTVDYANEYLFKPLGTPGYGLCMCAKDMAKIGQMCLDNGVWEGKRIIHPG